MEKLEIQVIKDFVEEVARYLPTKFPFLKNDKWVLESGHDFTGKECYLYSTWLNPTFNGVAEDLEIQVSYDFLHEADQFGVWFSHPETLLEIALADPLWKKRIDECDRFTEAAQQAYNEIEDDLSMLTQALEQLENR